MKTLIKALMIMYTFGIVMWSQGWLHDALSILIGSFLLLLLLAIPYGLLTNLFEPSGSRRERIRAHTDNE